MSAHKASLQPLEIQPLLGPTVPLDGIPTSDPSGVNPCLYERIGFADKAYRQAKQAEFTEVHKKGRTKDDWILILGDALNMLYLGFLGLLAAIPSWNTLGTTLLSSSFGIAGGIINILVGCLCLKEAKTAFANKDKLLGWRLLLDGAFMIAIGGVMLLASMATLLGALSIKVGFFVAISAFLAANPWVLPVLFLIITLPILYEVTSRVVKLAKDKDCGAKMHLPEFKELFQNKDPAEIAIADIDDFISLYSEGEAKEHQPTSRLGKIGYTMNKWWKGFSEYHGRDGGTYDLEMRKEIMGLLYPSAEAENNYEAVFAKLEAILEKKIATKDGKPNQIAEYEKILKRIHNKREYTVADYQCLRGYLYKMYEEMQLDKIEEFQAEMGVKASMKAFEFFDLLIALKAAKEKGEDISSILDQLLNEENGVVAQLDKRIKEWNRAQKVRLTQQLLYVVAFPISLVAATSSGATSALLNSGENFAMGGAAAIPFVMDLIWPYKRNVPRVIEKPTTEKVAAQFELMQEQMQRQNLLAI